MYPKELDI